MNKIATFVPKIVFLAALVGCGSDTPEAMVGQAKSAMAKKDNKSAIIHLRNALQMNSSNAEARFLMGKVLLADGDAIGAAVELDKAQAAGYPVDEVAVLSARAMLRKGEVDKLLSRYGSIDLKQPAGNSALQVVLAGAELAKGREAEARRHVGRALELKPDNIEAQLLEVSFAAKDSGREAALKMIDNLLDRAPENSEAWLLKAGLLAGTDAAAARKAFERALKIDPSNLSAHAGLITLLNNERDLPAEEAALKKLRSVFPAHPLTKYFEAQYALAKGDAKAAKEIVQVLLKNASDDVRLNALAGFIEARGNNISAAEAFFNKALLADPGAAGVRIQLGILYIRAGDAPKALTSLTPIIQSAPERAVSAMELAQAHALAGRAYLMLEEPEKAEVHLSKAVALAPKNLTAGTMLAISQMESGRYQQGIELLQEITAKDDGVVSNMALIAAMIRKADYEKALIAVDALDSKGAQKGLAANLRGQIESLRGHPKEARSNFESALKLDPDNLAVAQRLANMDLAGGRADLALERFEAIRKRNPKSTPAVIAVAEIKMMTESSRAEARKIVEDALASDSGSVRLRLALSGMLVASQDFRQATSVLQTGLATEPENIDLLQALAQVQRRSGDGNQALNTQRRVVSLRPGDPVHVLHLAELQITRGDKVGAENSLTKAIELKGDFLPAQILLSRLLVERNKVDAGRTIVKKIQSQRPNEGIGYALEAELALREKAPAKAMAAYRVSLDKTKSPEIAIRLHRLLSEAKRQAEADELERKWLEDRPEDAVFLNYSAELALKRGDQKASLDRFKALLKIDPNNAPVLNNTAWLLEQMNLPGSLELIDRALKLSPRQPAFLDTKASILAGAGNWSDALKIQREAVTLSPNEVRYRLRLAAYLLRNDKKEEARGELEALEGDRSVAAQVAELKRALNPR